MLSRLALRNVQTMSVAGRAIHTTAPTTADKEPWRPKRLEYAPVRHGFLPECWFTFLYPKTGVSGPYIFATTVSTYLISKEWYVIEHEFYTGLSLLILILYTVKKLSPVTVAFMEKSIKQYEENLQEGRNSAIRNQENTIEKMETLKWQIQAQKMIYDIKKQNVIMQLEATYRERMAEVYKEVKKRLDFHAQIDSVERRITQKHMVQWVINNVLKAITPDQEKATLKQCIKDLQALSAKA